MNSKYRISPGSKFSIDHGNDEPTIGVFKGLSVMGGDTALVFEMDAGVLRFINSAHIVSMDLLEESEQVEPAGSMGSDSVYYG